MENKDQNRYEGKSLRCKIYKELSADVSIASLSKILKCKKEDLKKVMKKLENEGYIDGVPYGTALCWGCKWASGLPNKDGKRCSWAESLTPRAEWLKDINYIITVREPETGEKGLCVQRCNGFDLNYYKLEKKYIVSILLNFYRKINKQAFTYTFFTKSKSHIFDKWLQLFNEFRATIGFKPFSVAEPEEDEDDDFVYEEEDIVQGLLS